MIDNPHASLKWSAVACAVLWSGGMVWWLGSIDIAAIVIFSLAGASVHGAVLHISSIFTDRAISAERAALVTSLAGAGPGLARVRRRALRDTVARICALAEQLDVDALLCGGDL